MKSSQQDGKPRIRPPGNADVLVGSRPGAGEDAGAPRGAATALLARMQAAVAWGCRLERLPGTADVPVGSRPDDSEDAGTPRGVVTALLARVQAAVASEYRLVERLSGTADVLVGPRPDAGGDSGVPGRFQRSPR